MIGTSSIIMKHNALPSLKRIHELLEYDRETGIFKWKVSRGPKPAGSVAGNRWNAYITITIDDTAYQAHRLAWLILTGQDPGDAIIDHDDLNKHNNKANNLKLVTRSENGAKTLRGEPKCYQRCGAKRNWFQAVYTLHGKRIVCGTFRTAEEASKVGREARRIARGL